MTEIGIALATLLGGFLVDRYGYNRRIAKIAEKLAPALPGKTARQIAEAAIIEANYREAARAVERANAARAKHEARLSAIESGKGEINVGNLKD